MADIRRPENMQRITTPELAEAFIEEQITALRAQIGDRKVLLALSGGVDSSVVAALLIKAVGQQLTCVHVNHGLLRKGEPEQVIEVFRNQMNANLIYIDAVDRFLDKLAGVTPKPSARSSEMSLSRFLQRKRGNWTESACWHREQSGRTFWRARPASKPITMQAACRRI